MPNLIILSIGKSYKSIRSRIGAISGLFLNITGYNAITIHIQDADRVSDILGLIEGFHEILDASIYLNVFQYL